MSSLAEDIADDVALETLGYKQELSRGMTLLCVRRASRCAALTRPDASALRCNCAEARSGAQGLNRHHAGLHAAAALRGGAPAGHALRRCVPTAAAARCSGRHALRRQRRTRRAGGCYLRLPRLLSFRGADGLLHGASQRTRAARGAARTSLRCGRPARAHRGPAAARGALQALRTRQRPKRTWPPPVLCGAAPRAVLRRAARARATRAKAAAEAPVRAASAADAPRIGPRRTHHVTPARDQCLFWQPRRAAPDERPAPAG